ncbi:MAG TPA: 5-deoxy-glucuronate isomerase [Spirochaetia bacterium]|nr:5-deoxy-glucuronate isomerase [Spirochaetia bacterium]
MHLKNQGPFSYGYTPITEVGGRHAEALMDFGILRLRAGETWHPVPGRERALLLLTGTLDLEWTGGKKTRVSRSSYFDEAPWCLSLPADAEAGVTAVGADAEVSVHATENPRSFPARLFTQEECRSEARGKGTMGETSTRIVRTILEDPRASWSHLVLGEVITYPGKWSSYPPHHHPQPEIYHYRIQPSQGFGLTAIGDEALVLRDRDTVIIPPGAVHPHTAAPGYAMFYIWVIRHLDGNRYGVPTFVPEHAWVTDPKAKIWG